MTTCIFCDLDSKKVIDQTPNLNAFYDAFPVTEGHILVIPKAHRKDFFELSKQEFSEIQELLDRLQANLKKEDPTISGFNIGANCGEDAGQTVFHCHVHLIPRRRGDTENPKGGVRGVIPSKQSY